MILLSCDFVYGQINTDFKVNHLQLSEWEGYKQDWKSFRRDSLEKINTYKQRAKDEVALLKQQIKDHKKYRLYTQTIDSLQMVYDQSKQLRDSLTSVKKNIDWKALYAQSVVIAEGQLAGNDTYQKLSPYKSMNTKNFTTDSVLHMGMIKSEERLSRELEVQLADQFQDIPEIQDLTGEEAGMSMLSEVRDNFIPTQKKISKAFDKASQLSARDSFVSNKEKVVEAIQVLDTAKLKNKQIGTFEDGDKHNDLSERLSFGGNLQVEISETTLIDFSPWIGWSIKKQWMWGIGANYKSAWNFESGVDYVAEQEYLGARVFTEYEFWKGIYLHGEAERLWQTHTLAKEADVSPVQGINGWLIGLGKSYQIKGKLQGNFQVLYNFGFEEHGPYNKPWIIRFGLRFN